uniref:Ninjurin 2 n=1 Tax=Sinocyclocheilus grahami TaxID=75366 RepID=A0A672SDR0_SINGR
MTTVLTPCFSRQVSHSLGLSRAPLNMNHYANKSVAESMLDVALLMANASQLKAVLGQGPQNTMYTALITLISLSLCLQVLVGILPKSIITFLTNHLKGFLFVVEDLTSSTSRKHYVNSVTLINISLNREFLEDMV